MKKYELNIIFAPTLPEADFKRETDELRHFLKANDCKVFFEDIWGMKNLAYRIRKQDQGYYAIFYFESEPEKIIEIRTNMKLNINVLRHLLITLPDKFEAKKSDDYFLADVVTETEESKKRFRRPIFKKKAPQSVVEKPMEVKKEESPQGGSEPLLKGKTEEERLQEVEKTLESILENPDIKLK